MDSLKRVGLLQPITISPDGHLICGFRRLEAAKALQWRTVRVWVRSGLSDELTRTVLENGTMEIFTGLVSVERAAALWGWEPRISLPQGIASLVRSVEREVVPGFRTSV